ncbi:SMI1/KNR4 family protein [Streptomyces sp. NPDC002133]|uniref:SMI1/KNR4 family protein n=1 Tax=Streptomyces sp. NPDC002133 TaxID=3154409 RepID=UPI00331801DC
MCVDKAYLSQNAPGEPADTSITKGYQWARDFALANGYVPKDKINSCHLFASALGGDGTRGDAPFPRGMRCTPRDGTKTGPPWRCSSPTTSGSSTTSILRMGESSTWEFSGMPTSRKSPQGLHHDDGRKKDMHPDVEVLVRLMPPHEGAGGIIDWSRAQQAWGIGFPADYKEFVSVYGAGSIGAAKVGDFLGVMVPEVSPDGQPDGSMDEETKTARHDWAEDFADKPEGVTLGAEHVVAWGVDSAADLLCWLTEGDDPDAWPVVIYSRSRDAWFVYQCGMTGFLRRLFQAEFDEYPLSFSGPEVDATLRFLTHAEERRIRQSGRDPWNDATL